jgi:hypothetical protein
MQNIIEMLSTKVVGLEFTGSGKYRKSNGLDKLTAITGLSSPQISLIFSVFLDSPKDIHEMNVHLKERYLCLNESKKTKNNINKAVIGAFIAFKTNAYRVVECYKCKGKGCNRCGNTGKTSKKPKSYELCGFPRGTWNNKSFDRIREAYNETYDYLIKLENEINQTVSQNKCVEK